MSDEDRRDAVVTLAVYPDTKREWETAVNDDPHADSLSQLIRVAVNRHLHDQSPDSNSDVPKQVHEQLTELSTEQERLVQQLDNIKGQLTDIRDAVIGSAVGAETEALAEDVFEVLPSKKEVRTEPVLTESKSGVPAPEPGSVEWLNDRFNVPRYQIQAALEHLRETTYAVQQTDDGCYFKEV